MDAKEAKKILASHVGSLEGSPLPVSKEEIWKEMYAEVSIRGYTDPTECSCEEDDEPE